MGEHLPAGTVKALVVNAPFLTIVFHPQGVSAPGEQAKGSARKEIPRPKGTRTGSRPTHGGGLLTHAGAVSPPMRLSITPFHTPSCSHIIASAAFPAHNDIRRRHTQCFLPHHRLFSGEGGRPQAVLHRDTIIIVMDIRSAIRQAKRDSRGTTFLMPGTAIGA